MTGVMWKNFRGVGFTLVEMLLATVLAALLMGAVVAMAAGLSRDRKMMEGRLATERPEGRWITRARGRARR